MGRRRSALGRVGRAVGRGFLVALAMGFACGAYIYLTLPDVRTLRTRNPETTAFMELRARQAQEEGEEPRHSHRWVSYSRVSQNLKRAVLVAEDSAFWQHDGIDFEQIKESMGVNLERMEFARGASTITQQLAKNLYLSPSRNPIRKLRELLITRRLEAELSKRRILELYLNLIEWGDGVYGAEAAARRYFGKSAASLTADESALLAAAIINPRVLDPGRPDARLRRRQQMILGRMGAVTPPGVADPAGVTPALPVVMPPPVEGPPAVLPGQIVPGKPPGGAGSGRMPEGR
jgi:monofunctional biosynthetic peptidoglycan transglycosylase